MAVLMGCIADDFTGGTDLASIESDFYGKWSVAIP